MSNTANLELPFDLKEKIERPVRERNEEPATFLASAIDSLLSAAAPARCTAERNAVSTASRSVRPFWRRWAKTRLRSSSISLAIS